MTETQATKAAWDNAIVTEILKAKTRWIHTCLKSILPDELYKLAAADNELDRVRDWCKAQGYSWREFRGESQLWKDRMVIAIFRPELVDNPEGGKQVAFHASVYGQPVAVVV